MTEEQKALLNSFPKRDRGLFGDDVSDQDDKDVVPDLVEVEDDFVEAAAKKAKLKQAAMRERRRAREEQDEELKKKRVRFLNDVEQDGGSDEDAEDSDAIVYDSEEEDLEEKEYRERQEKKEAG